MGANGMKSDSGAAGAGEKKAVAKRKKKAADAPSIPGGEIAMASEQEKTNKSAEGKAAPSAREKLHDDEAGAHGSEDIARNCEIVVRKAVGGFLKLSGAFAWGAFELVQGAVSGTAMIAEKSVTTTAAVVKGAAGGVYDAGGEVAATIGPVVSKAARGVCDVGGEVITRAAKVISGTARSVSEVGSGAAAGAGKAVGDGIDAGKEIARKAVTATGKAIRAGVKAVETFGAAAAAIVRSVLVGAAEGVQDALSPAPPGAAEQP